MMNSEKSLHDHTEEQAAARERDIAHYVAQLLSNTCEFSWLYDEFIARMNYAAETVAVETVTALYDRIVAEEAEHASDAQEE